MTREVNLLHKNETRTIVIDFRDVPLAGMKEKEWIASHLVPCILRLGTGDFAVDITLPRWLGAHFIPGWESLGTNNIQAWGTHLPEHATFSTLFRITHVIVGGTAVAARIAAVGKTPPTRLACASIPQKQPMLVACAGISKTAIVATRTS